MFLFLTSILKKHPISHDPLFNHHQGDSIGDIFLLFSVSWYSSFPKLCKTITISLNIMISFWLSLARSFNFQIMFHLSFPMCLNIKFHSEYSIPAVVDSHSYSPKAISGCVHQNSVRSPFLLLPPSIIFLIKRLPLPTLML